MRRIDALFLPMRLADRGKASERFGSVHHGVTEDHEQPADDREVSEEESEVENESVAEALDDDNGKEGHGRVFSVTFRDDCAGRDDHSLYNKSTLESEV